MHWGSKPPAREQDWGTEVEEAAMPLLVALDLLSDTAHCSLQASDVVPFANASSDWDLGAAGEISSPLSPQSEGRRSLEFRPQGAGQSQDHAATRQIPLLAELDASSPMSIAVQNCILWQAYIQLVPASTATQVLGISLCSCFRSCKSKMTFLSARVMKAVSFGTSAAEEVEGLVCCEGRHMDAENTILQVS